MNQYNVPNFLLDYFVEDDLRLIQERLLEVEKRCRKRITVTVVKSFGCDFQDSITVEPDKISEQYQRLNSLENRNVSIFLILDKKQFLICHEDDVLLKEFIKQVVVEIQQRFREGAYLNSVLYGINRFGEKLLQQTKQPAVGSDSSGFKEQALRLYQDFPSFFESTARALHRKKAPDPYFKSLEKAKNIFISGTVLMEESLVDWFEVYKAFQSAKNRTQDILLEIITS